MLIIQKHKGLLLVIALTALVMAAVGAVDRNWTVFLYEHKWPHFQRLMNRSIFDGETVGPNDVVIFFLMGAAVIYTAGRRGSKSARLVGLRPASGFILSSALYGAVCLVHSLKLIVGRARPGEVLNQGWPFTHWFSGGPHFITEGLYHAAFPSGHTAQAFVLMSMAYLLAADPFSGKGTRACGWVWGALCIIFCIAMAAARSMSLSHWISDCLASILLGWILMHLTYFYILRIPVQRRFFRTGGARPVLPPIWEIVLGLYVLVGTMGITALALGSKAIIINRGPWLAVMVPIGAGLTWWAYRRASLLLHRVWRTLDGK